jgi:hypothetical protein
MHSIVYEPSSHLRDGGGMFSGRLKYIIKKAYLYLLGFSTCDVIISQHIAHTA